MPKVPIAGAQVAEQVAEEENRRAGGRGINQVTLVGRLARDPEVRTTGEGVPRAWFVLAVPRAFAGKDGDRDVDFINIVAWRQLASVVGEHLQKGRLVGVAGRLQVNTYEASNGERKTATEVIAEQVIFLDAPRKPAKAGG